ncbi:uncharacterized protein LOC135713151 [Ochlerotatus camptorhynchus]|uniref:uncharacterized protein LOC135713151 n=1 Tax=Ochlerotatus camptorhynchus TaxID=644619 RepID=UPI0031E16FBC
MDAKRENTLVVDFSVLPKRPDASAVQKFMCGELKLDIADALNIQFHNVRNCVYVGMVDAATAKRYFASHHLKHTMQCEKKANKIPVFVEDEAVNVRIHDLPPKTPSTVIIDSMRPYGTILSISREMWKNYFPGIHNGLRVVRMKIKQLIPSYLMIDGETILITYRNQAKTCRFCGQKAHPRLNCNSSTSRITVNDRNDPTDAEKVTNDENSEQTLLDTNQTQSTIGETSKNTQHQHSDGNNSAQESTDSELDEFLTVTNKRRLSTKQKHNNAKRYVTNQRTRVARIMNQQEIKIRWKINKTNCQFRTHQSRRGAKISS